MLDHFGQAEAGKAIVNAMEAVTAKGEVRTADMGGKSSTSEVTKAVIAAL